MTHSATPMQWTQKQVFVHIRLIAATVIFTYAATHFINHALGLISLDAMESGRKIFLGFWRSGVGQWIFPVALFFHTQSALWRLMFRETWRFSTREKVKILAGLSIPFLLFWHIAGTRLQWWVYGHNDTYSFMLLAHRSPWDILLLTAMTALVWVHAFLGITTTLDLKPWFQRIRTPFLVVYTAIPVLGIAGILSAMGQVDELAKDTAWREFVRAAHGGSPNAFAHSRLVFYLGGLAFLAFLLAALFIARAFVLRRHRRKATINVSYADGPVVRAAAGVSLLDVSLMHGIEHAHVCGGNGRCSTCRVRVLSGLENLSAMGATEATLLKRIGAESDMRLACQSRLQGDVRIAPLIGHAQAKNSVLKKKTESEGAEREIVVLFSDLQGFTAFSEHRLPYDVVFVLNQYFRGMGKIIEDEAGHIDKFIGDGIMALFGLKEDIATAARHALAAAHRMQTQLATMNDFLANELKTPLKLRIGIHAGAAIVGDLGYGNAAHLTAIGDVVNTASRLEHANKKLGTWLLVSDKVVELTGDAREADVLLKLRLRGKSDVLAVHGYKS